VNTEPETVEFDILFIGAGPANLTAAIHLRRLLRQHNATAPDPLEPSIAVIDKGRYPGAHLLSGAILDPGALREFMPDYSERGFPSGPAVSEEGIWYLTKNRKLRFPSIPDAFSNHANTLCSLSRVGAWMAGLAEEEGIDLFEGTAAVGTVVEDGRLTGVLTDDKGVDKNGTPGPAYEPGLVLKARATVIGEGAGGSLTAELDRIFNLRPPGAAGNQETGVKECWRIPSGRISAGTVRHTFGYPLPSSRYGGGWIYALSDTELSVGFVTSVERHAPAADPHLNLQRFKEHPFVRSLLEGGTILEAGARTITSGGYDAMGRISGEGFLLVGESAGMLDMRRLKGIHLAMKSGMLAAETLFEALCQDDFSAGRLAGYEERFRASWAHDELVLARNYRQAFDRGLYHGLLQTGISLQFPGATLLEGKGERTKKAKDSALESRKEMAALEKAEKAHLSDGILTFTKADAIYRSATVHEENQPCHLRISPEDMAAICLDRCRHEYGNPCTRFCPAGVYELTDGGGALRINASNCLHCKTCEAADPYGIITWTPPEGGGGPGYKIS
jgi:electron-transferring-flavoprotein dehydrogenase